MHGIMSGPGLATEKQEFPAADAKGLIGEMKEGYRE
jgi:hypothetical protein